MTCVCVHLIQVIRVTFLHHSGQEVVLVSVGVCKSVVLLCAPSAIEWSSTFVLASPINSCSNSSTSSSSI